MTVSTLIAVSFAVFAAASGALMALWTYYNNRRSDDVFHFWRAQLESRKLLGNKFKDDEILFPIRWSAKQKSLFWDLWAAPFNPYETENTERIKKWLRGRDMRALHNKWLALKFKFPTLVKMMEKTSLRPHQSKNGRYFRARAPHGGKHRNGWKSGGYVPSYRSRIKAIRRAGERIRLMALDGWRLSVPCKKVEVSEGRTQNRSYGLVFVKGEGDGQLVIDAAKYLLAA
jgi:hypothetical protein